MLQLDLSNRVAFVTGGGQGLGLATTRKLIAAGASVAIGYLDESTGENARIAHAATSLFGDRGLALPADVRDSVAVDAALDKVVAHFGRLDFVVNNAAVIKDRTIAKMTDSEWRSVIDTNLTGVFHVCRAAQKHLADGGRIVNMASISGTIGFFGQVNYSSAKAGVIAMTKVLAKELARRRITVNAVAPGVVLTEMGQSIPENVRAAMLAQIPMGRLGEADDIASAIVFLCSDLASYITGQTLHVNGGWWAP
jgi:3-oxoacyl-[acyl-carrier protein] reductase